MSLKGFHKLFICLAMILCGFFGYWALNRYETHNTLGLLISALVSFALTGMLLVYSIYFFKKTKAI